MALLTGLAKQLGSVKISARATGPVTRPFFAVGGGEGEGRRSARLRSYNGRSRYLSPPGTCTTYPSLEDRYYLWHIPGQKYVGSNVSPRRSRRLGTLSHPCRWLAAEQIARLPEDQPPSGGAISQPRTSHADEPKGNVSKDPGKRPFTTSTSQSNAVCAPVTHGEPLCSLP